MMEESIYEKVWVGKLLQENQIKLLCEKVNNLSNQVKELLIEESNVQPVSAPVIVCGDIRGHFYDLIEIFTTCGIPPFKNYLFLGNYVNKGINSVETFVLLIYLKTKYPTKIILLRGANETLSLTKNFGLLSEIMSKYGNSNVYRYLSGVFEFLPINAVA